MFPHIQYSSVSAAAQLTSSALLGFASTNSQMTFHTGSCPVEPVHQGLAALGFCHLKCRFLSRPGGLDPVTFPTDVFRLSELLQPLSAEGGRLLIGISRSRPPTPEVSRQLTKKTPRRIKRSLNANKGAHGGREDKKKKDRSSHMGQAWAS